MSQKSITSFFKPKPVAVKSTNSNELKDDQDHKKVNKPSNSAAAVLRKGKRDCNKNLEELDRTKLSSPLQDISDLNGKTNKEVQQPNSPDLIVVKKRGRRIIESDESSDEETNIKKELHSPSHEQSASTSSKCEEDLSSVTVQSPYTIKPRKTAKRPNRKRKSVDSSPEATDSTNKNITNKECSEAKKLKYDNDKSEKVKEDKSETKACISNITEIKTENEPEESKPEIEESKKPKAKESKVVKDDSCPKPEGKFVKKTDSKQHSSISTNSKQSTEKKTTKSAFAGFGKPSSSAGTNYNPTKSNYHPIDDACWDRGQKVPYLALAKTFEAIEDVSSRLKMMEILSNLLRSVVVLTPDDFVRIIYLCLNKLAPAYEGVELGIGETILMKAIAQATGRTLEKIKIDAHEKGDLGLVAETSRGTQRTMFQPAALTIQHVFNKLKEIATMSGNSVQSKKTELIKGLFVACRECEARYIIRSLGGKLRIGLAEQSVLGAIGQAVTLTPPNQGEYPPPVLQASKGIPTEVFKKKVEDATLIVKSTYCECPNYDAIVSTLLTKGVDELPNHCRLTPGVPLKPMLAHPTKGVSEVFSRFDKNDFTCEFKYDGERAQIHLLDTGEVHIYSRNSEDNTSKYPDIISRMPNVISEGTKSAVLDSEAVAFDVEKQQILPFQILSTRKRKDADIKALKVQVCVYAFDLLYLNGRSLVQEPLRVRQQLLRESFTEIEGEFVFAKSMHSTDTDDISMFLEESIKGNCEGLMVKTLDVEATYEIAKRSHNWLKLKKDYLEGVGDTLDVVVLGAYHGTGKRTGKYGGFLLGIYDDQNEDYGTICKIGTGFKDTDLEEHSTFFKEHVLEKPRSYYRYDHSIEPDVWFDTVQVWEIKCADISISPVHTAAAGTVDSEKGISLRFPRFLRKRDDKKPEETTSPEQLADLYRKQQVIMNQKQTEEEDFY